MQMSFDTFDNWENINESVVRHFHFPFLFIWCHATDLQRNYVVYLPRTALRSDKTKLFGTSETPNVNEQSTQN